MKKEPDKKFKNKMLKQLKIMLNLTQNNIQVSAY
jgi:hypothetical protein